MKDKSALRSMLKNLSRAVVVVLSVYFAVVLANKLDKFLSLLGALLCAPLAFTFPTLIHLKLIATKKNEKVEDIIIIFVSFAILVFCTA